MDSSLVLNNDHQTIEETWPSGQSLHSDEVLKVVYLYTSNQLHGLAEGRQPETENFDTIDLFLKSNTYGILNSPQ